MSNIKTFLNLVLQLWLADLSNGWLFSNNNCYREHNIGCFPLTGHFTNTMGFSPQSPAEVGVRFVYKDSSGDVLFTLEQTRQRMQTVFNPSLKTIVIIHGYLEDATKPWIGNMVHALRSQGPMNIFIMDWSTAARHLNYLQCVANSRMAGALGGLFLQELIRMGASPSSFHVIGFSLGAQVAGYVGARVPGVGRITGLDPAGPGFFNTHQSVRLDPSDADLVDVVHTDDDMGYFLPLGTVDFYPNGGANQPLCGHGAMDRLSSFMTRMDFSRRSLTSTIGCSHIRAPELFTSSITNNCTYAMKMCDYVTSMVLDVGFMCQAGVCPTFGYHLDLSRTPRPGIYRFTTSGSHPFC